MSDIRKNVEALIDELRAAGIDVTEAAVLKLGTEGIGKGKSSKEIVREIMNTIAPNVPKQEKLEEEEVCFCNNCFTFGTFEETLKTKKGGAIDYASFEVSGKIFDVKHYVGPLGEHMMCQERSTEKASKELTAEDLQLLLNEAIVTRDFPKAQDILNQLNNLKFKN